MLRESEYKKLVSKESAIKSGMAVRESKDCRKYVPFYELDEERYKDETGDIYNEQKENH